MSMIQADSGMSSYSWPSHDPGAIFPRPRDPRAYEIQRQLGNLWRHRQSAESIRSSRRSRVTSTARSPIGPSHPNGLSTFASCVWKSAGRASLPFFERRVIE